MRQTTLVLAVLTVAKGANATAMASDRYSDEELIAAGVDLGRSLRIGIQHP